VALNYPCMILSLYDKNSPAVYGPEKRGGQGLAYLVLYREWRPQTFQEIVGQEHINRTLQNALVSNRIGHAYLFCGPRGTGKTTMAKVLAKALNCSSRQSSEPCNTCVNCQEIAAGNSMDVIEIDAASHRGIDEIRELREKVRFSPTTGNYRVYIIDEVHMLTSEAFNALLKTLEEPPSHVVFILATTEPHKVPLTILSRCQRFDFHRIGIQVLLARLKEISGSIGLEIEESALYLIARAAEGGLRDALSILDQIAAYGDKKITAEDVHRLLGTVREGILDEITAAFSANDTGKALSLINTLTEQGKDLRLFVRELLTHLRTLLLLLLSPGVNGELSPAETERLSSMATALGQVKLLLLLNILTRTEQEMKWSSQPGILLEVALVQAFCAEYTNIETELAQKVHRLEELVEELVNASSRRIPALAAGKEEVKKDESKEEEKRTGEKDISERRSSAQSKADTAAETEKSTGKKEAGSGLNRSAMSAGMDGKKKSVARTEKKERPAASKESAIQKEEPSKEELRQTSPPEDSLVLGEIIKRWEDFLDEFKKKDMPAYMFLVRGWPQQLNNGCLVIAFEEGDISKLHLEGKANQLSTALASYFLRNWQVRLAYGKRPSDMEFNHLKKELSTQETLTLFGVLEEQGNLPE
jgi:DNA polymerase-3 subunit gamma/tau